MRALVLCFLTVAAFAEDPCDSEPCPTNQVVSEEVGEIVTSSISQLRGARILASQQSTNTVCDGPFAGLDNGGHNMNDGAKELTTNAEECREKCAMRSGCVGYTWKQAGHEHYECWLKSEVGEYRKNDHSSSGDCKPAPKKCDGPFAGLDNGGHNMNDGAKEKTKNAEECREKCATRSGCVGYTWKQAGHEHYDCWLKSEVGEYQKNDHSSSGDCKP